MMSLGNALKEIFREEFFVFCLVLFFEQSGWGVVDVKN